MSLEEKNEYLTFISNMWSDTEKIYENIEKELELLKIHIFIFRTSINRRKLF